MTVNSENSYQFTVTAKSDSKKLYTVMHNDHKPADIVRTLKKHAADYIISSGCINNIAMLTMNTNHETGHYEISIYNNRPTFVTSFTADIIEQPAAPACTEERYAKIIDAINSQGSTPIDDIKSAIID